MTATICLSSTNGIGNKAGRKLITDHLGDAKGLRACTIGAAHEDSPWEKKTVAFFEGLGIPCAWPRLSDPELDVAAARMAIESADILHLNGGDPAALLAHAKARKLVPALRAAAKRVRLIFALSAGACALAPYTITYPDGETPELLEGLDLGAPLPVDVHDEPGWDEMHDLLKLSAKEGRPDPAGIVIPTDSALIVRPDGSVVSRGKHPCERRRLAKNGAWKIEPLERE
jgi:peptidase E